MTISLNNAEESLHTQTCPIVEQKQFNQNIFHMTLEAEELSKISKPGQFVHIRIYDTIDPLLRRPFSIHRVDRKKGRIEILYRVVGKGTGLMCRMKSNQTLDLMGPLGNGFDLRENFDSALIVAGGLGCAPVFFLIDELFLNTKKVFLFWGARTANEMFQLEELKSRGVVLFISTEDGSNGYKGYVTELLENYLKDTIVDNTCKGFACGPYGMFQTLQKISENLSMNWQAALEEKMACGMGVCQGCAIRMKNRCMHMVCSNGPVFDLMEIDFDG